MHEFIQNSDSAVLMVKDLRLRMTLTSLEDWSDPKLLPKLSKQLASGQLALVDNKINLMFKIIEMNSLIDDKDFINTILISEYGGPKVPCFMISLVDDKHDYSIGLAQM